MDDRLFDLLKREMRLRRWNVSRLAEACGADIALTSRWVAENPDRRVIPSPKSCEKIAAALGADPDYILTLAGHRKQRDTETDPDPIDAVLAATNAEMRELLRDLPRVFWDTVVKAFRRSGVEGARELADILSALPETTDSGSTSGGLGGTERRLTGGRRAADRRLAEPLLNASSESGLHSKRHDETARKLKGQARRAGADGDAGTLRHPFHDAFAEMPRMLRRLVSSETLSPAATA